MKSSTPPPDSGRKDKLTLRQLAVFSMYGTLMYCSKVVMEAIPNVHLLGMFTMLFTVVYRKKALIPIYIYVMINGIFVGFATWWLPYLYLWAILWGVTMLLPRNMPAKTAAFVYPIVCALHGLAFGTLYAPAQAIMYGMSFKATVAWIVAGLPFDLIHCLGNLAAGFLVLPLSKVLIKLEGQHIR